MLPELDFKQSWGIEKNMYFDRKLKEFFNKNKNVKEPISRYNVQTLQLVRTSKEHLLIQRRKFGMLFHVAINIKDKETIGHTRTIHSSIKQQMCFLDELDKYLRNVRINETWANAIKKYVCDSINERCNRLEKTILPDLIKSSIINIYAHFLSINGTTLEQDIIDHLNEDDSVYYDHIIHTIEMCKTELPEKDIAELEKIRTKHITAQTHRKAVISQEKTQRRLEKQQEFEKDAMVILQNWATNSVTIEQQTNGQRNQMLYKNVFKRLDAINNTTNDKELKFTIIAIVKHNSKNKISSSAFRWLRMNETNDYVLATGFGNAEPFFPTLEPEKYKAAIKYCKEQNYVIATVDCDVTNPKKEPIIYDYYQDMPLVKWKKWYSFYEHPLETRMLYMNHTIHDILCMLQCIYVIRKAYELYGDVTHPINQNIELNDINSYMYELLDYNNDFKDIAFCEESNEKDCRPTRMRITSIRNHIHKKLQQNLKFALVDKDGQWVETVKSVVNLNSYTEEDLKQLYSVLEDLNQTKPIPTEMEN